MPRRGGLKLTWPSPSRPVLQHARFLPTKRREGEVTPNPSLQPTCYGWLRQPSQAAELKR